MGDSDKNIKITPNTGETANPKIEVTGGGGTRYPSIHQRTE